MTLSINSNIMAIMAQNNLTRLTSDYSTAIQRLSSGLRINSAADDPAGLAISETLKAQITGNQQASSNAQDAISMIQTGEGALNEVSAILQNINQLAVQASNSTLSSTDMTQINTQLQQAMAEINQIASQTKFNGNSLLDGSLTTTQSGGTVQANDQFNTTGGKASIMAVDVSGAKPNDTYTLSGSGSNLTLTNSEGLAQTLTVNNIAANGSEVLDFSQLGVSITVGTDGSGKTAAGLVTDLAGGTVTTAAGSGAANFQIGADSSDSFSVSFSAVSLSTSSTGALLTLYNALNSFNTTQSTTNAQAIVSAVNGAINTVDSTRGTLGAAQQRLQHAINSLAVAVQNLTSSQANIADVNVAQETTTMVTAQIATQAATSALAQANNFPQAFINLIRGQA